MSPQFGLTEQTKTEEKTEIDQKIKFDFNQSRIQAEGRDSKRSLLVTKYGRREGTETKNDFFLNFLQLHKIMKHAYGLTCSQGHC